MLGDKGFAKVEEIKAQAEVDLISRGTLYNARAALNLKGITFGFDKKEGMWAYSHVHRGDIRPAEQQRLLR